MLVTSELALCSTVLLSTHECVVKAFQAVPTQLWCLMVDNDFARSHSCHKRGVSPNRNSQFGWFTAKTLSPFLKDPTEQQQTTSCHNSRLDIWYFITVLPTPVLQTPSLSNYGASEASVVFRRLTEISEYERPAGRPWSRV